MQNIVIIAHVVVAVAIVGLVLLQQGKGADAGASFGSGASQTMFGSTSSGNFLVKATTVAATVFFITSLTLAIFANNNAGLGSVEGLPPATDGLPQQTTAPADDLPQIDGTSLDDLPRLDTPSNDDLPQLAPDPSAAATDDTAQPDDDLPQPPNR